MAKNIVVLSDGTGQEGGKGARLNTNVYKMFTMLEDRTPRQVAFYDPGLGTGWRKVTGNIAGAGISRNLLEAYRFIFDNYERGDRIFLVGFSRGATTVRSLAGFINHFGLLPQSRPDLIKKAYKIYKTRAPLSRRRASRRINNYRLYLPTGSRWQRLVKRVLRRPDLTCRLTDPQQLWDAVEPDAVIDEWSIAQRALDQAQALRAEGGAKREVALAIALAARQRLGAAIVREARNTSFSEGFLDYHCTEKHGELVPDDPRTFMRAFRLETRARKFIAANYTTFVDIEFLGCFDTVAALGLPFPSANAILNLIPPMRHQFHDLRLPGCVANAYQALALDDERKIFRPEVWDEPDVDSDDDDVTEDGPEYDDESEYDDEDEGDPDDDLDGTIWTLVGADRFVRELRDELRSRDADELIDSNYGTDVEWDVEDLEIELSEEPQTQPTIRQVWFTGSHTDVGGGYRERGLADITLSWMLSNAHRHGILLDPLEETIPIEDPVDVLHDSRGKLLTRLLYRAAPRMPTEKSLIHESVYRREAADAVLVQRKGRFWERARTVEVEGSSAFPISLRNDPTGQDRQFRIDPWYRYRKKSVLMDQEAMWKRWASERPFVKRGDQGSAVEYWQYRLLQIDGDALPDWGPDGDYGDEMASAVYDLIPTSNGEQIGPAEAAWLDARSVSHPVRADGDASAADALQPRSRADAPPPNDPYC